MYGHQKKTVKEMEVEKGMKINWKWVLLAIALSSGALGEAQCMAAVPVFV